MGSEHDDQAHSAGGGSSTRCRRIRGVFRHRTRCRQLTDEPGPISLRRACALCIRNGQNAELRASWTYPSDKAVRESGDPVINCVANLDTATGDLYSDEQREMSLTTTS
jgi:hypothetical protein